MTIATLNPLDKRLFIKWSEAPEISKGGIEIPFRDTRHHCRGEVVAAGAKCEWVKVGDEVLANALAGQVVTVDGQKLLATTEDEILAVLEKK